MRNSIRRILSAPALVVAFVATALSGCTFGLWNVYGSADVDLAWALSYDGDGEHLMVADLHANGVKVVNSWGGQEAYAGPIAIDHLTPDYTGENAWFGLV